MRAQSYLNRVETVVSYPGLAHHLPLFKLMRPVHMSGDESEYGDNGKKHPPTFKVVYPEWQSHEMRQFHGGVDGKYRNAWGEPPFARGNPPRTRITTGLIWETDSTPPAGLPENCYNPSWLAKLDPWVKESLRINWGNMWDFTIPDDLGTPVELSEERMQALDSLRANLAANGSVSPEDLDGL